MRVLNTPFIADWHENKAAEVRRLTAAGKIPIEAYAEDRVARGDIPTAEEQVALMPLLMGQCAGAVADIKPAREIIADMVATAAAILQTTAGFVRPAAKL